ncbi:MAG: hypothetical protein K9L68_04845 [Spirochaetales bacterium]|nr:hypothetical protein [Spirochaetales bacterium]MCF7937905.1 hypothetical protein [Spirochaetales bacterium]
MKRIRILLSVLLFFLIAGFLSAQNFELVYLDGRADIRKNGEWLPLRTGDSAPPGSTIKLSGNTIAEFAGPQETRLFSKPGNYNLSSSSNRPAEKKSSSVASIFNRLIKDEAEGNRSSTTVMGVRGSEAVEQESFDWVDEDTANFERAVEAYTAEKYEQTIEILENDVDPLLLNDSSAYWYYLAASYDAAGSRGKALKVLRDNKVENFSSVYSDYLLLNGRLSLESYNYANAEKSFALLVQEKLNPGKEQLAYYLLGISRLEQGDNEKAARALEEAVRIGAEEEVTRLARNRL